MADDQFSGPRFQGAAGRLQGCGMMPKGRLVFQFLQIGRFMIKQVHTPDPFRQFRERCRIAHVGITAWHIGQIGGIGKRDDGPVRSQDILSPFQGPDLRPREAVTLDRLFADIVRRLLFPEKVAEGLDPVIQREGQHFDVFRLVDYFRSLHLQGREPDLEGQSVSIERQEELIYLIVSQEVLI